MEKKFVFAGIPVLALLLIMVLPLLTVQFFGSHSVRLFRLFDGNAILALLFLIVPLGVAYCGYANKYMNIAPWVLLLPFLWLLIWNPCLSIGAGAWLYLILSIVEIVLALKPDLLDSVCGKK